MPNIETTDEGYLLNWHDWSPELAQEIAAKEQLQLTDAHWEIINCLRQYYQEYDLIPPLRIFIKYLANELNPDKAKSIRLHKLFPNGPLKQGCKIAGLPKPKHCM